VIQLNQPARFLQHKLSERGMVVQVTGARMVDRQVEYQLLRGGQPCQFQEPHLPDGSPAAPGREAEAALQDQGWPGADRPGRAQASSAAVGPPG
jgi:hypothetical protein